MTYGLTIPRISRLPDGTFRAIAGPAMVTLHTAVPLRGEGLTTIGEFDVTAGGTVACVLTYGSSHWLRDPTLTRLTLMNAVITTKRVGSAIGCCAAAGAPAQLQRGRPSFTHSQVMAWVAFDSGVKAIETCGLEGPLDEWRVVRAAIHDDVCTRGFDRQLNSFVQAYGTTELDASLLLIPSVGSNHHRILACEGRSTTITKP